MMADMPIRMKIEVRAPGSGIDFRHACKRVDYWEHVIAQCELNAFGEYNDFMRIKAIGCLEEWQYIKWAMCPYHNPVKVGTDPTGKYTQMKCNVCGQTKWVKDEPKDIRAGITANTFRPEFGG